MSHRANYTVFRIWRPRKVVWTKDDLYISRPGTLVVVDCVPLREIEDVMEMSDDSVQTNKSSVSLVSVKSTVSKADFQEIPDTCTKVEDNSSGGKRFLVQAQQCNILQIKTALDGYNSGKTYYLSTRHNANPEQDRQIIVSQLSARVKISRRKAEAKSRFQKSQEKVQIVQGSLTFQLVMAAFIVVVIILPYLPKAYPDSCKPSIVRHSPRQGRISRQAHT
jgi:hypothetical protein